MSENAVFVGFWLVVIVAICIVATKRGAWQ